METTPLKPAKPTAVDAVKEQLREQILKFDLQPGERLHVDKLRLRFGVSTATMREALSRLLIDNLVTSESQRGFRVRELSAEDFCSISEARKAVEVAALRASLAKRDEDWEGDLMAAYHKLQRVEDRLIVDGEMGVVEEWHQRNRAFHDCLVRNCANPWLIEFRHKLHQHSDRYHRLVLKANPLHRDVREEHAAIVKSAIDGDVEACVALVEDHIDTTVDLIARQLPKTSEGMARSVAETLLAAQG